MFFEYRFSVACRVIESIAVGVDEQIAYARAGRGGARCFGIRDDAVLEGAIIEAAFVETVNHVKRSALQGRPVLYLLPIDRLKSVEQIGGRRIITRGQHILRNPSDVEPRPAADRERLGGGFGLVFVKQFVADRAFVVSHQTVAVRVFFDQLTVGVTVGGNGKRCKRRFLLVLVEVLAADGADVVRRDAALFAGRRRRDQIPVRVFGQDVHIHEFVLGNLRHVRFQHDAFAFGVVNEVILNGILLEIDFVRFGDADLVGSVSIAFRQVILHL